jgi:hypothetical protein
VRTTLDIEEDVLLAAKELAAKERTSTGAVISRLARKGLAGPVAARPEIRNGVPVFPARPGEVVTVEHVQRLLDEEPS